MTNGFDDVLESVWTIAIRVKNNIVFGLFIRIIGVNSYRVFAVYRVNLNRSLSSVVRVRKFCHNSFPLISHTNVQFSVRLLLWDILRFPPT